MRILLIDDDSIDIEHLLNEITTSYVVDVAKNAEEGLYFSQSFDYSAVLVDGNLPDMSGADLCKRMRKTASNVPILFLSDTTDIDNVSASIDAGADDYVFKPLIPKEIILKLRSLIRRFRNVPFNGVLFFGDLHVDLLRKAVFVKEFLIPLRKKEFSILEYLIINRTRVVSEKEILDYAWGEDAATFSNTVAVHIKRLRTKIELPFNLKIIKNVRGFGYKFEA